MEKSIHSARHSVFLTVLRKMRIEAGLTQVQLAEKIGESQTFVSKYERGERRIDLVELRALCEASGTTLPLFIKRFEQALRKSKG